MRLPSVLALVVSIAAAPASAQNHDAQLWISAKASAKLREGVKLQLETNQRFSDDQRGHYGSQYLAALAFDIAPGVKLIGGVNRVVGLAGGRVRNTEWRPRQQISFPITKIGGGELAGRVRFEQRFRRDDDKTGHRVRPGVSYALPLSGGLEVEFAHENYFNLNSTGFQNAGHERMRSSATLIYPVATSVNAEVGYMNQYRFNGGDRDQMDHVLTTALSISF